MNRRSFEVCRFGTLTLAFFPFLAGALSSACGATDQLPSDSDAIGIPLPPSTSPTTSKPNPTPTGTTTSKPNPTPTGTATSTSTPTSNPPPPPPPPKKGCEFQGVTIPHGASFPADDGCNTCSCNDGSLGCTRRACPVPVESACIIDGKVYESGSDGVPDPTSCNSCRCESGKISECTLIHCPLPKPCQLGRAIYRHDSSFVSSDGTTQCRCDEGDLVCKTIP